VSRRPSRRTLALVLVVELAVGALLWFSNAPAAAQPPSPPAAAEKLTAAAAECPKPAAKPHVGKSLLDDLLPIGILIAVIAIVVIRLPRVELGHSAAFRHRRLLNWLPLGLTYSFLYFGRYNIKQYQGVGLTTAEYAAVFGWGSLVYGFAFLLNGPLTDR